MTQKQKFLITLLVIVVVTGVFSYWKICQLAVSELTISSETIFTLPAGSGQVMLEAQLESKHIIPASPWFGILQKIELTNLKSGTYQFTPKMTVRKMLQLLSSGKEAQFPLRFVEGTRMQEWLNQLHNAPYIEHTLKNNQLATVATALKLEYQQQGVEGWFYPDTYFYTAKTSDVELLKRANARMVKLVDIVWHGKMANLPYKNKNDMLTMASMIEKETSVSSERSRVASVFINRLQLGMHLQTDPTVIYGMGDKYKGTLTLKDLETPTTYNTYTISGLPPGPIAMPGKASLEAAAHPDKTNFLYFVADGKGGHTFTTNLSSHNKAVQIYRRLVMQGKNER